MHKPADWVTKSAGTSDMDTMFPEIFWIPLHSSLGFIGYELNLRPPIVTYLANYLDCNRLPITHTWLTDYSITQFRLLRYPIQTAALLSSDCCILLTFVLLVIFRRPGEYKCKGVKANFEKVKHAH
jgi:hypothetical protein